MLSAHTSRLALRQSRCLLQRRAQSSASETAAKTANKAKEGASEASAKAQQGLSRVTSSAGNVLSSASGAAMNAVSGVGGRTGSVIQRVLSRSQHWQTVCSSGTDTANQISFHLRSITQKLWARWERWFISLVAWLLRRFSPGRQGAIYSADICDVKFLANHPKLPPARSKSHQQPFQRDGSKPTDRPKRHAEGCCQP